MTLVAVVSGLVFIVTSVVLADPCLHKGCDLTGGLNLKQFQFLLERDPVLNNKKTLLTVLQWNILYDKIKNTPDSWKFRKSHVCDYINQLKPEVRI